MGGKALAPYIAGALIPLSVPIIHFPSITAIAAGVGAVGTWVVVYEQAVHATASPIFRDWFPTIGSISVHGAAFSPDKPTFSLKALAVGLAVSSIILTVGYVTGAFDDLTFLDRYTAQPERNLILSLLSVVYVLFGVHAFIFPKLLAQIRVRDQTMIRALRPKLDKVASHLSRLQVVQRDIDLLYRDLGLSTPRTFFPKAVAQIADCKLTAQELSSATKAVSDLLTAATREKQHLERATGCYITATKHLSELRRVIESTHNPDFSEAFEELSQALSSDELRGLARRRKWRDFFEVISLLIIDIDQLAQDAHRRGRKRHNDVDDHEDSVTLKWAYKTLRVKPTATAREIKASFRALCVKWHPDTGKVRDDSKIKEITRAYHVLKKAKQFA